MTAVGNEGAKRTEAVRSDGTSAGVVVVDLGRHKRKEIKRLRQGTGKLMDDVRDTIAELRANGTISGTAEPVVLIVREKRRTPKLWF
jgi:Family of unknown function (DUF6200)